MSKKTTQSFLIIMMTSLILLLSGIGICIIFQDKAFAMVNMHPRPLSRYFPAKVGCFIPKGALSKLDCTEQLLNFEILRRLMKSSVKKNQTFLSKMILERARFFLHQQYSDYQSIATLMVFPVEGRLRWLKHFAEMGESKGRVNLFAQVALDRLMKKKSVYCEKRDLYSRLWEICSLKIM